MNLGIQKNKAWALGLALISASSMADTTTTATAATAAVPAQTVTAAVPAATGASFYGLVDIRPTMNVVGGASALMENFFEAGAQITPNVRLTYAAAFDNSLNSGAVADDVKLYNGFLRLRVKNILQSDDKSLSLNSQTRLFTPTDSDEREKGFITTARTYLTVAKKFSDALSVSLSSAPQLNVYTKAGLGNNANKGLLEHMVILDASVKIIGPVSLYFPIILQTAQYQEYKAGAKRNGALVNTLWVWPELGVAVNDNHTVGLSYRSANLASENLAQLTLGSGLEKGVAQLYWTGTF